MRRLNSCRMSLGAFPSTVVAAVLLAAGSGGCGPSGEIREANRIGLEYYHGGDHDKAIDAFEHARRLDPERPEASYYIGRCYLAMAERKFAEDNLIAGMRLCDRAAADFQRSYAAFPGYTDAIQGKAEALKLRGKHAVALALAEWASSHVGAMAKMLMIEAKQLAQSGDLDRSLRKLKQAVAVEPENAATHAELGRFYLRCGNDAEAIAALRKAYDLNPGAPGVVSALAQLDAAPDRSTADDEDVDEPPVRRPGDDESPEEDDPSQAPPRRAVRGPAPRSGEPEPPAGHDAWDAEPADEPMSEPE